MAKMDDAILQLKIDTLTESLLKCTNKFSNLNTKYHKEINELKPDLDDKNAEVNQQVFINVVHNFKSM